MKKKILQTKSILVIVVASFFVIAQKASADIIPTWPIPPENSYDEQSYVPAWSVKFNHFELIPISNNLPLSEVINDGRLHIPDNDATITSMGDWRNIGQYWTSAQLIIPPYFNGDNVKLEARIKAPLSEGAQEARDPILEFSGVNGKSAFVFWMADAWGGVWAKYAAGDTITGGIPEFVKDFNDWHTVALETKNGKVTTFYDGQVVKSMDYSNTIGLLYSLRVGFKGRGSIDWVKLYEGDELKLTEDFDINGTTNVHFSNINPPITPTHEVAYIPVKFSDGSPYAYSVDQLKQRARKVEEYYSQQSQNAVVIDSDFLSDNWIHLDKKLADFSGTGDEKWKNVLNYVTTDDFIKVINPNFVGSDYKSIVVVQPECITSFVENVVENVDGNYVARAGKKLITSEKKSLATWAHELGHSLFQFGDYCDGGNKNTGVRFWDLMGAGTLMNPTAPLMSYNKIEKSWLGYEQQSYGTHSIDYLSDNNYSGKPIRYDTPNNGDIDYYILEGRNPEIEFNDAILKDDTLNGEKCPGYEYDYKIEKEKGVLIYQVNEKANPNDNTKDKIVTLPHANDGNNNMVTLKPGDNFINPKAHVKFSLAENLGKLEVKAEEYVSNDEKVISLKASYRDSQPIVGEVLPMDNQSDIDLHVVSLDGKRVGMNYDTGEYENQIEGALTSYNIPGGGPEWISIPNGVKASYYVDATPLKKWAEETGANVTNIEADFRVTTFDENGNRQDSEEITVPIDLANPITPLAVKASVEMNPKTLNLKSNGNWITAYMELPDEYDTRQIIGESVVLNNQLKADKIEFGDFDSDGTIEAMMKFDRTQVANILVASNTNKVTISGDFLHNGIPLPFSGESSFNTINPGSSPK